MEGGMWTLFNSDALILSKVWEQSQGVDARCMELPVSMRSTSFPCKLCFLSSIIPDVCPSRHHLGFTSLEPLSQHRPLHVSLPTSMLLKGYPGGDKAQGFLHSDAMLMRAEQVQRPPALHLSKPGPTMVCGNHIEWIQFRTGSTVYMPPFAGRDRSTPVHPGAC